MNEIGKKINCCTGTKTKVCLDKTRKYVDKYSLTKAIVPVGFPPQSSLLFAQPGLTSMLADDDIFWASDEKKLSKSTDFHRNVFLSFNSVKEVF